jgi:hypothetical protein
MIRPLNNLLKNKRIPLLIILNLCLIVFIYLAISIINENKVAFDIYEAKREASERAGRILRAERADVEQKRKEEERKLEERKLEEQKSNNEEKIQ